MCPAPSGGTYEAARGPGRGGEPARVVWVGEPKLAEGLGETQRAQEARAPLTADLECALPSPTSPTQRPPSLRPGGARLGALGEPWGHRWARSQGPGGAPEFKGKRARVAGAGSTGLPVTPSAI